MKVDIEADELLARFKSYVSIETTSDDRSKSFPSTACQLDLAEYLQKELQDLGFAEVKRTEYGYVLATVPATTSKKVPVIGLIAHLDTSDEASGRQVRLQVHKNYDGGRLVLGHKDNQPVVLDPALFPELKNYQGQDLLTSDGTTLLGADDKAGACAIVTACHYLLQHPEIEHGKVRLAFNPDEETGRGTEYFPLKEFGADYAYTVDGGELGEINYETFNACNATIVFNGISVHTGTAKHKMRNAVTMAAEWQLALPRGEAPEYTEGYEGFYHTMRVVGSTAQVELNMLLRDHDRSRLEQRKAFLQDLTGFMNSKYGAGSVTCNLQDMYYNMKEYILPFYEIVEAALAAMKAQGVEPHIVPVRGGTDGAHLSEAGLPCPNLFTGGHNFHGCLEYLPLPSLVKITRVLVELVSAAVV